MTEACYRGLYHLDGSPLSQEEVVALMKPLKKNELQKFESFFDGVNMLQGLGILRRGVTEKK